jgi:hypothetical protein
VKYFPLLYRLQGEERYLIWISNEKDFVAIDSSGFVPSFRDLISLREYADLKHYGLETEEPILHDLDWVAAWRMTPGEPVKCVEALAAWNLFSDVSGSVPRQGFAFKSLDSQFPTIYKKLFHGNNLPSLTPEGEQYTPEWSADELGSLAEVLTAGLDLFVSCVRPWTPTPIELD